MIEFLGYTIGDTEFIVGLLVFIGFINVLLDLLSEKKRSLAYYLSLITTFFSIYYVLIQWTNTGVKLLADDFTKMFTLIYLLSLFLILIGLERSLPDVPRKGLLHGLILLSVAGMIVATSTYNIIGIIVAWELASIPTYALIAIKRDDPISLEAATKFFIIGAVGSAIMLFGLSLIYGATGRVDLVEIYNLLGTEAYNKDLLDIGLLVFISGIGFKLSLFPFYVWLPDAVEGAPNFLSAFILGVSKAMAFGVALRIFYIGFPVIAEFWTPLFGILALITMTFGNLAALVQKTMKRMLAYSSIAHAGYIVLALAAIGPNELIAASMFHIFTHALMKVAAFAIALIVTLNIGSDLIEDYSGMAQKSILITLLLSIDMLSLAGIPILAGFWSKYFLFLGIAESAWWLGLAGFLNSAMSLYYYARVIYVMVFNAPKDDKPVKIDYLYLTPAIISIILLIAIGIYPKPVYDLLVAASKALLP